MSYCLQVLVLSIWKSRLVRTGQVYAPPPHAPPSRRGARAAIWATVTQKNSWAS